MPRRILLCILLVIILTGCDKVKDIIVDNPINKKELTIYQEEILNGAYPELEDKMIPVYYDDNNWKTANIYEKWYSYQEYNWANVVYVKSDKQDKYKESDTIINLDDVLGFFVWIPRYEYKLFNVNNELVDEQLIDIKFVSKEEEVKNKEENGSYYTHPAFGNDLNGIWFAKFEPSIEEGVVRILPNKKPIVSINMAKMWEYATGVSAKFNSNLESRNITNMEWGAVVYLIQSKYGKLSNENYSLDDRLVFINNSVGNNFNNLLTGCSSGESSAASSKECLYKYDVDYYGTGASSTGTIYGVYDLVGGAWDCVMGVVSNYPIKDNLGGYNGVLPKNERYYSFVGIGNNMFDRSRGSLGDATREVLSNKYKLDGHPRGWNGDYAYLAISSWPWVKRGGAADCSEYAGIFSYGITDAIAREDKTFRVVLS